MKILHRLLDPGLLPVLAICLSSCATSATLRQKRVEANPQIYQKLSAEDRQLVNSGRIREGLAKEAVFLAWGRPDDIRNGSKNGVPYETWHYKTHRPYSRVGFSLGYGYGLDPYYRHYRGPYYSYPYYGFHPSVTTSYVPVDVGSVEFLNDKVVSWEARTR